ncbi:hypothetical protein Ppa06_57800 [Planomonospora parontospora subsp. parontospora]|uniref:Uncharacterized protein n=2 Tax=Planomonospora parontospora TaxID=58119 RepID=A0AA37F7K1_9ACTN|nr:hypothetical protein [Planomonospora parontospora]GGK90573.1 hypothetical protein GCM10010126_57510 [Planomonospora parontospora]GII11982.1 hypothetical protein Ppa06_57800 [Planomonospora parontospora subsp. parontospora]
MTVAYGKTAADLRDSRPVIPSKTIYGRYRKQLIAYGQWQPRPGIDAEPVRAHLRLLQEEAQLGLEAIASMTGVGVGTMQNILYGKPSEGKPAARTVLKSTADKLLGFWPTLDQLPGRVPVDATGTRRRVHALMRQGWSMTRIAAQIGSSGEALSRMIRRRTVLARLARAVRDVYDDLWDVPAPARTAADLRSVNRTKALAARRGYVTGMSWDDDTIDDPNARPDPGARVSRDQALAEDSDWLMTTQGLTVEQAAERLDVTRDYLDKARSRHQRRLTRQAAVTSLQAVYAALRAHRLQKAGQHEPAADVLPRLEARTVAALARRRRMRRPRPRDERPAARESDLQGLPGVHRVPRLGRPVRRPR